MYGLWQMKHCTFPGRTIGTVTKGLKVSDIYLSDWFKPVKSLFKTDQSESRQNLSADILHAIHCS